MALTEYQRRVCRLLANDRRADRGSYVAGGAALNVQIGALRLSRHIDVFHDAGEAVAASWRADLGLLEASGYRIAVLQERPAYVEALVTLGGESVAVQWTQDSVYRFFPLQEHPELGLTLSPVDLATNKVLALVGRLEVRDWVDLIEACARLQPLGYLAWAASGKDPGLSPEFILEQAGRSARYTRAEVETLAFDGPPPDAADLSVRWRQMISDAHEVVRRLPAGQVGTCVLTLGGDLLRASPRDLPALLDADSIVYHAPALFGALPTLR